MVIKTADIRMQNWKHYSILIIGLFIFGCSHTTPEMQPPGKQLIEEPNPDALNHFMEGQLYMNQRNYAMAVVELQNALHLDQNVSTIHLSLADCYWMLQKTDLTIFHMEKAIALDPWNHRIIELLAKRHLALKDIDRAKSVFGQLISQNPDSVKYLLSLAELEHIQENFETAVYYYQKAHLLEPTELSHLEKAVDLSLKINNPSLSTQLVHQLILLNPSNLNYVETMLTIALAFGNKEKAIWAINRLMDIKGQSPTLLNKLGILYFNFEDIDSALVVFKNVLNQVPTDPSSLHYLTLIYDEKGEFLLAEQYAKKLILHHPDDPIGYTDISLLYLNHNLWEKSMEILAPVSKKFSNNFTIQFLMGLSLNQSKNKPLAIPFYEQAIRLNPNSRNTLHNLAILYDSIHSWTKSDSLYEILIQSDSTDAQALNNYAFSLVERHERLNFALELSRQAVRLVPESAAYLDTMGWILFSIGNHFMALDFIKQSIDIEDNNPIVLEHLGDVYKATNDNSNADFYWNKAFHLNPENEHLKKKLGVP
jgi:tetratricopeptide (TPR) repeat protein